MSEFNQHRHAMRVLRDLERQIGAPQAQASPQAPPRNTRSRPPMEGGARAQAKQEPWTIPNLVGIENDGDWNPELAGRNLAGAAREGARFWGNTIRPVAQGVQRAAGALAEGFDDWNANQAARTQMERDLERQYMPRIRAANNRTGAIIDQDRDLMRREDETVARFDRGNEYIQRRLDSARMDGMPVYAPHEMSDEELMAELAMLERGGGR